MRLAPCVRRVALTALLVCCAASMVSAVEPLWMAAACKDLRIGPDGEFKILQLSDLEYTNGPSTPCKDMPSSYLSWRTEPCDERQTTRFMRRLLAAEQPDLIIITGDSIIAGATDPKASLTTLFRPLVAYKRPWALLFGNHDEEAGITRMQMLVHARQMDPERFCTVPGSRSLPGVGNFNLTVRDPTGTYPVYSLILFDSGKGYNSYGGYDWITSSQVQWFKQVANYTQQWRDRTFVGATAAVRSLSSTIGLVYDDDMAQAADKPNTVPILMFFHIPLPEFRELLEEEYEKRITGTYQEKVWHSSINGGLYAAAVENGNVRGMFVGHDHLNDFCHRNILSGIYMCYAGTAGYGAYSKPGFLRRARLISGTAAGELRTWKRLDDLQLSVLDDEKMLIQRGPLTGHPDLRGYVVLYLQPHVMRVVLLVGGFIAGLLAACFGHVAATFYHRSVSMNGTRTPSMLSMGHGYPSETTETGSSTSSPSSSASSSSSSTGTTRNTTSLIAMVCGWGPRLHEKTVEHADKTV